MVGEAFEKLVKIMKRLRSKDGCPWDKEQTHQSLKPYLLEEAYEVIESIDNNDPESLKEELGDLLLQPIFHSQIAQDNDDFTIEDVINTIIDKLIRRHPHVFDNLEIKTSEDQKIHWEKLKKHEGKKSVLEGIPKTMPALNRAHRVQQRAATVGFDWNTTNQVWEKIQEEIEELKAAIKTNEKNDIFEEFGDLLFALVNLSRFLKLNPEDALRKATDKFSQRFHKVEQNYTDQGKDINRASLQDMDKIWNKIKKDSVNNK
ncbi:MAG: nucleoside triphosphate pyrophosphohydrolase [bacterium]